MEYRVLARKYRPTNFKDLVGQEVLVRTLGNAFATGRIAHAFLLTGIRGIGKTTTARIIARALNCIGADGTGGPTTEPCGVCSHCKMIGEDRHPDVLEMDAASRTGVDAMRDLIETVRYLPSSARTKVYIIDEVHMLSTSAFNALLKTLEEPPPHVKFIFATTEVRKIPVTILSRCQRFDLKRLDITGLAAHLGNIAEREQVQIDSEALTLLSIAAEGSVRDGLSLLDQVIAHRQGESLIAAEEVRGMLGLADRSRTIALLTALLKGEVDVCLRECATLYYHGADPLLMLQDVLEMVHFITRVKLASSVADDPGYSEGEREAAKKIASEADMAVLTRAWQMLLKGIAEVKYAPSPIAAVEMVLIRMAYAANLPTPEEALNPRHMPGAASPPPESGSGTTQNNATLPHAALALGAGETDSGLRRGLENPTSFEQVIKLFEEKRDILIASQLRQFASLVSFAPGQIELYMQTTVPREFYATVMARLNEWTGGEWKILPAAAPGAPTMEETIVKEKQEQLASAGENALVKSVMEHFPGAEVVEVLESAYTN